MSYVGNAPAVAYTNTVKDTFSGDNSTVAFTLSVPSTTNNVRVVVENVIQDPTVAYSVSGTTLTFTSAPPSGTNNIYVVHLGPAVQTVQPPTQLSGNFTLTGDLTQTGDIALTGNLTQTGDITLTGDIEATNISDGTTTLATGYVVNGSAKAWANLNGTGTIALQDSFNVSGVTDNGTGLYTFTFSSAMDNANYVLSGAADTASAFANVVVARTRLAGSQQIVTTNGTAADLSPTIGIHGDLA
jgi:hypothetical protein